ncbi:MAG: hypothetical protein LBP63_01550 [Prevotellaceae bacterium]|jgi:ABC-type transport system involved in cytochrome c biogenesis permease subunit|nr:hypothetical protein [Prevotellaceae bacterium]
MSKKCLSALFVFAIIFIITFLFYSTINISIAMSLVLFTMALGKANTKLSEKEILMILTFLSIITVAVIIIVNVCSQKELFRTILMCIAIPALAFSAYYISKRLRKTKKNV